MSNNKISGELSTMKDKRIFGNTFMTLVLQIYITSGQWFLSNRPREVHTPEKSQTVDISYTRGNKKSIRFKDLIKTSKIDPDPRTGGNRIPSFTGRSPDSLNYIKWITIKPRWNFLTKVLDSEKVISLWLLKYVCLNISIFYYYYYYRWSQISWQ